MEESIFSRTSLIHFIKTQLLPNKARLFRGEERAKYCSTGIISRIILDDGNVVSLMPRSDGRVGAVYIRVSTPRQADYQDQGDSFSPDFQVWNCAMHFIHRNEAFAVYTDAGLSGADPIDNADIMKSMWATRARNYGIVFTKVLLSDHTAQYTSSERASMIAYRTEKVKRLSNGGLLEAEFFGNEETSDAEHRFLIKKVDYRPGLTVLVERLDTHHTIAVIDMSRLARSQFLFQVLTEMFTAHRVEVVAVTQNWRLSVKGKGNENDFDSNTEEEMGQIVSTFILSLIAQYRISEAMLGAMRGIVQMLKDGCPHAKVPFWIKRIKSTQRTRQSETLADDSLFQNVDELIDRNETTDETNEEAIGMNATSIESHEAVIVRNLPFWLKTKYVYTDPVMLNITLKMVDWYLNEDDEIQGLGIVAARLNREIGIDKYGHQLGDKKWVQWRATDVGDALSNMALIGVQSMFGLEWQVYPPILIQSDIDGNPIIGPDGRTIPDRARFDRIKIVRAQRASKRDGAGRPTKELDGYLLDTLFRCHCGRLLTYYRNPVKGGKDYYKCPIRSGDKSENPNLIHVMLRADDSERFVEDVVRYSRRTLLNLSAHRARNDDHYLRIAQLRSQLDKLHAEIVVARDQKRHDAEELVQNVIRLAQDHPKYLSQVELILNSLMLEYQDRLDDLNNRLSQTITVAKRTVYTDETTIEERLERWPTLTTIQKRLTLQSIIKEMRLGGRAPNEYVELFGHDDDTPVTVRLITKIIQKREGVAYERRFPTKEQLFDQLMMSTIAPGDIANGGS